MHSPANVGEEDDEEDDDEEEDDDDDAFCLVGRYFLHTKANPGQLVLFGIFVAAFRLHITV